MVMRWMRKRSRTWPRDSESPPWLLNARLRTMGSPGSEGETIADDTGRRAGAQPPRAKACRTSRWSALAVKTAAFSRKSPRSGRQSGGGKADRPGRPCPDPTGLRPGGDCNDRFIPDAGLLGALTTLRWSGHGRPQSCSVCLESEPWTERGRFRHSDGGRLRGVPLAASGPVAIMTTAKRWFCPSDGPTKCRFSVRELSRSPRKPAA